MVREVVGRGGAGPGKAGSGQRSEQRRGTSRWLTRSTKQCDEETDGERPEEGLGADAATRTCRIWRDGRSAGTTELGMDPRRRCLPAEGVAAGSEKLRERQAGGEERSRGSSTGPTGEVRRDEAGEPGGTRYGGSQRWGSSR